MTAINAFLKRDRAILMTDAAIYTPQGLVVGFGQKAVAIPAMKAAIAVRGVQKIGALLAMEMSVTFDGLDELAEAGAAYFDEILPRLMDGPDEEAGAIQVIIVGWSDSAARPAGYFYDSTADEAFGVIDGYVMAPMPDDEEEANLARQKCSLDVNLQLRDFDPLKHGVPLMKAQRRMKIIPVGADMEEGISIVGGNILVTEVTQLGTRQYVAHRWNDGVGESIIPDAAPQARVSGFKPKVVA